MHDPIWSKAIPIGVLIVAGVLEALGGLYWEDKRTRNDWTMELVSLVVLPTLIQPGIFLIVLTALACWAPASQDLWMGWPMWAQACAFLLVDDLTQYAWHRASHHYKWLWKLHRPHHVIQEMGVLVTYRNAVLYYALMPGIWGSAVLVHLGMGPMYAMYLVVKLIVIILAHSETKWDRVLYRSPWLHPIAWVVERTISHASHPFCPPWTQCGRWNFPSQRKLWQPAVSLGCPLRNGQDHPAVPQDLRRLEPNQ